jgi:hypothetical protein
MFVGGTRLDLSWGDSNRFNFFSIGKAFALQALWKELGLGMNYLDAIESGKKYRPAGARGSWVDPSHDMKWAKRVILGDWEVECKNCGSTTEVVHICGEKTKLLAWMNTGGSVLLCRPGDGPGDYWTRVPWLDER